MVSKLTQFLQQYYAIYIDDICDGYFEYQGTYYYLSNQKSKQNIMYISYMHQLDLNGFHPVLNCFGLYDSDGYVLYAYKRESYSIEAILHLSMRTLSNRTMKLLEIKKRWCHLIDEARNKISSHASKLNHNEYYVILSYYYQGMAETCITVLNEFIKYHLNAVVPQGFEHIIFEDRYEILCNPDMFLPSSRIRDLSNAYLLGLLSIKKLEEYIITYQLDPIELNYLFLKTLFPGSFFYLILTPQDETYLKQQLIYRFQRIEFERNQIFKLYELLKQYIYLPYIPWLMSIDNKNPHLD